MTLASQQMGWLQRDDRKRRVALALAVYVLCTLVFFLLTKPERLHEHTPFNHFALLAESWLQGRLDLGGPPPAYAQMNDFAEFNGRWFIAFPPFPALLLLPWVWLAGGAEGVRDGQAFLWLAGIGPAVLFLVLEKLRRRDHSKRNVAENVALALLFAFGSVYFFSAEQGTVWFAAHVVGAGLCALYVLFALDAERPLLAGLMLGFGFLTRAPLAFAAVLFALEALRVCSEGRAGGGEGDLARTQESVRPPAAEDESARQRLKAWWQRLDKPRLVRLYLTFAAPAALCVAFYLWHNYARFGSVGEVGYRYLKVRWAGRMETWGLFHYHFLGRNLGVMLSNLPYWNKGPGAPFQINAHGLALWFTTPMYLWLLWPARGHAQRWLYRALWATVAAVSVWTLLYQNTGWQQFGQRFSNDYAIFLFMLLALGGRRFGWVFRAACVWAIAVNGFGAWSFDRPAARGYYVTNPAEFYQRD
ncbi:MAG: hypothetical protein AB7K71_06715 [Polyangiaceae bacterium]